MLNSLQIVHSRWHVPLQSLGSLLALAGYFLGHAHRGRQFSPNIHAKFATPLMLLLLAQITFGVYLRLHLSSTFHKRLRRPIVLAHGILGKSIPVLSWVQFLFGGITALGFCRGDHLGQCLAHFIMGSAFIAYGTILSILLLVGQAWLARTNKSQEFYDSTLIAAWGCVNTFTEHRWGTAWVKNDLQHTSMGIVWWCAGLLGVYLSLKGRDGRPRRNLIPAIVILLTGWAMGAHPQSLELSTHVHSVFGYTLMAAGAVRIVEIAFVLHDRNSLTPSSALATEGGAHAWTVSSWQHLTPFLLIASGLLFMSAQEEQMAMAATLHVSHVSFILIIYSFAFLMYLLVIVLCNLYAVYAWPVSAVDKPAFVNGNGHGNGNGHVLGALSGGPTTGGGRRSRDDGGIRGAEEFELEGLMSEDEDEDKLEGEDDDNDDGRQRRKVNGSVTR